LVKSQSLSRIFKAIRGDRDVFQVIQTRLNSFTKEDVPGLACALRCLLDLFGELVRNLNGSHKTPC
jgi:hypothetical protein